MNLLRLILAVVFFSATAEISRVCAEDSSRPLKVTERADASAASPSILLQPGTKFALGRRTAVITKVDVLPLVESEYSRRFQFDSSENPKLKELREKYRLDRVVAPGRDEFDRQVHLMDWVHQQFQKFGRPSVKCRGALEILGAIDQGQTFFCQQYAELMVSAVACLGWIDRPLALRRHQGVAKVGGSTEHSVTEIWSNLYRKWVMLDPTSNLYLEKDGVPLNAYEIRQEWFQRNGAHLVFVIGKERKKYRVTELPILLRRFADFGDLAIHPDELDRYGFIGYIPNTNLMDAGYDYGKMFIVQDELCAGTMWHKRTIPENPAVDPYFPLGQSVVALHANADGVQVALKTFTSNLDRFESRVDQGAWTTSKDTFGWALHGGANRVEVRTVNRFGVEGPVSTVEVEMRQP